MTFRYNAMLRAGFFRTLLPALILALVELSLSTAPTAAQEPLIQQLRENLQTRYLSIGTLLQTVGDFQVDRSFAGNNGFNVSNFRINIGGELDAGFGYFLQANFIRSPSILDAKMYYRISSSAILDIGFFKSPFSKELLTSAANIDFVNRAQAVTALAPARQLGVQLRAQIHNGVIYSLGVFNGNGFAGNQNDNDHLLYAVRLGLLPKLAKQSDPLELGFNLAYSEDNNATLGGGFVRNFEGNRVLVGGDVRWTHGRYLLSGEAIYGRLDFSGAATSEVFGFHATGGYMLKPKHQLLFRLDSFDRDNLGGDSHLLIFGYNHWPTQATELQVNYTIATDNAAIDNHRLLVNAQIGF